MRNYTAYTMLMTTPEQKEFLKLYAEKCNRNPTTVLRGYVSKLMEKYPAITKQAAENVQKGR